VVCRWETLCSVIYGCANPASAIRPAPGLRMPMGIRIDRSAGLATRDVMAWRL